MVIKSKLERPLAVPGRFVVSGVAQGWRVENILAFFYDRGNIPGQTSHTDFRAIGYHNPFLLEE